MTTCFIKKLGKPFGLMQKDIKNIPRGVKNTIMTFQNHHNGNINDK